MIQIPNGWQPRSYQLPAWKALEHGCKRVFPLWHRRAGKDEVALHWTAVCTQLEPATYWHMLPKQEQGRKAIWDAVNPHTGKRRIEEVFPGATLHSPSKSSESIVARARDDLMSLRFKSGAAWHVLGSDNVDSLVGSPPKGVVFSEWALADPRAWALVAPILEENNGWAIFPSTPRGRNHAERMFRSFKDDEHWFVQRLSAGDTGVFNREQLDRIRKDLCAQYGVAIGQAMFRQEYECSFEAPVLGAYYSEVLDQLENDKAITICPYDPEGGPVLVSFDLGIGDQTALWFAQQVGREVHILSYYASMGVGMDHYAGVICERFNRQQIGRLILPHDANQREKLSGRSVHDFFRNQGFETQVVPRVSGGDGLMQEINAVRRFLPRCVFDAEGCDQGINALRNYRAEYDENKMVLAGRPLHDWASHGADSFRTLVMGWDVATAPEQRPGRVWRRRGVPV